MAKSKSEPKPPAVIVPPPPELPTAPYPIGQSIVADPEAVPVAIVVSTGTTVLLTTDELTLLRARVALLEQTLRDIAQHGVNYTHLHNVLHAK